MEIEKLYLRYSDYPRCSGDIPAKTGASPPHIKKQAYFHWEQKPWLVCDAAGRQKGCLRTPKSEASNVVSFPKKKENLTRKISEENATGYEDGL